MSYNAIATIYLYSLYVTLTLACMTRSRAFLIAVALLSAAHIVATTSIKTNLGVLLGAAAAMVVYFRESSRLVSRHVFLLVLAIGAIAYGIATSDLAVEGLQRGVNRVTLGVNVLESRTDQAGYSGFEERTYWAHEGLKAWARNPLFGYGVEAFRANYGITSHSTPIDLLYNNGLIGFALYYAMFISLLWRLFKTQASQSLKVLTLASVVCNLFVGLSGTYIYQYFLAGSIAISAALLQRPDQHGRAHAPPSGKGAE
jgi:O-antigen ligase